MSSVIWKGSEGLIPQYTGADLQLADRVTDVDVYRAPNWLCRSSALLRGTYGTGARLGWVVASSKVTRERKNISVLTVNWEVGGPYGNPALLPLEDYRCEPVELYPKVERHKLLHGPEWPGNPNDTISAQTIKLCYEAVHGVPPADTQARTKVNTLGDLTGEVDPPEGTTWDDQELYGKTLLKWLDQGYETYYQAGIKYSRVWYAFDFPTDLAAGGVIEGSPDGGPMAGNTSYSWLRLMDSPEPAGVNGSAHKITSTWLGGPGGHWDPSIYPSA